MFCILFAVGSTVDHHSFIKRFINCARDFGWCFNNKFRDRFQKIVNYRSLLFVKVYVAFNYLLCCVAQSVFGGYLFKERLLCSNKHFTVT